MDTTELRVKCVPDATFNKIKKAAEFNGEFMCDMLRPKIRAILDKYPKEMKIPANTEGESGEIRIPGISKSVSSQLNNIADNLGVSRTQLMRLELKEIADNLPAIPRFY